MRIAVLGSGSKGNCLVVDGGGVVVMIDAGFAPREARARLRSLDLDLADVRALFITHGHGDHTKGAKQIAGSLGIRTYATAETAKFTSSFSHFKNHVPISAGETTVVGGLHIRAIKTPHDEPGSVCYVVDDGDEAFGIVTDLGWPDPSVGRALHGVDSLMVEFNHDLHMLKTGPYSAHLKRRIASKFGHLSNDDGAVLLAQAHSSALTRVLCAHLSEVNNTPDKVLDCARPVVAADVDVACAPQHSPTPWLRVRRKRVARVRAALDVAPPPAPTPTTTTTTASTTTEPAPSYRARKGAPEKAPAQPISLRAQMALFGTKTASTSATPATTTTTTTPRKERS